MSDSPRTDEATYKALWNGNDGEWRQSVDRNFARTLEEELDAHKGALILSAARVKELEADRNKWFERAMSFGGRIEEAARDLHDYLWENNPDLIDISTHSELAGEGLKKRLQALKDALNGPRMNNGVRK